MASHPTSDEPADKTAQWDRDFDRFKQSHPGATFAQFYVQKAVDAIRRGGHTSLGPSLRVNDGEMCREMDHGEAGKQAFERYLSVARIEPHHRVIDYGCGSLRIGLHFINYLDPGNYFGLDVTTDFIAMGKTMVGEAVIAAKQPQLDAISDGSLRQAEAFQADVVFSNAVAYHVHPDEVAVYLGTIKRLTGKAGAQLLFDAKVSEPAQRYRQRGWSWPLQVYADALAPLRHVGKPRGQSGEISSVLLRFQRD